MTKVHWTRGKTFAPGYLGTREGLLNMYVWLRERAEVRAYNRGAEWKDWKSAGNRARLWIMRRYEEHIPEWKQARADSALVIQIAKECGDDMRELMRRIDEISHERAA